MKNSSEKTKIFKIKKNLIIDLNNLLGTQICIQHIVIFFTNKSHFYLFSIKFSSKILSLNSLTLLILKFRNGWKSKFINALISSNPQPPQDMKFLVENLPSLQSRNQTLRQIVISLQKYRNSSKSPLSPVPRSSSRFSNNSPRLGR